MGLGEGEDPWVGRCESGCRKMSGFPLPGGFVLGECPQTLEVSLLLLLDASWSWQIWKPANLSRNSSRSIGARHPPGTSSGQEHLPCQSCITETLKHVWVPHSAVVRIYYLCFLAHPKPLSGDPTCSPLEKLESQN